ncbi:hypothetical protein ABES33_30035 [Bacillus pseudomycoides]|uniref:hypothetical protein n=1 Tax=Bacillus pseudomycoides TaxID=64104 RepID=UPI003D1A2C69
MMKLLPVMDLYQIKLQKYRTLNNNITYPVLLVNEKYILKRVPSEIVVNEVLFSNLIKKKWINNIVLNKYDRIFTYYDSCFWLMTTYIKGEEFQHSDDLHLNSARGYLKKFIEISPNVGEIEFHDNFSICKWYQNPDEMIEKTFQLIDYYYGKVDIHYSKRIMDIYNTLEFDKNEYKKMEKSVSHGEYQNTNILFDKNQINLIDWDSLSVRPHIFDIVSSACYLCRDKRGDFIINTEKLKQYLDQENLLNEEMNNLRNMVFLTFIPKEDKLEKFYLSGHDQIKWYLEWTLEAMEKCVKHF